MSIRHAIISVIKTFQQTQPHFKTFEAFIKPETLTSDTETWRQKRRASRWFQLLWQKVMNGRRTHDFESETARHL